MPAPHSLPEAPGEAHLPPPRLAIRLRRQLLTGLVVLAPVALTGFILLRLFRFMDGIFAPVIDRAIGLYLPGAHLPGLGFLLTLLVVLLLGWLSTKVLGRTLLAGIDRLIDRIPVARSIYGATKGVLEVFSRDQSDAFKRVVLVEYPRRGLFAPAFVTASARWPAIDADLEDALLVFLPTSPNPTSGYLLLVPRNDAVELPISVEEGIRMVISGGILLPPMPERVQV